MEKRYENSNADTALNTNELNGYILLNKTFFNEDCRKEIREINKHEIIVKICEILGSTPGNLPVAEEIFDAIKYEVANYVVHHEFDSPKGISTDLLLWLDTRTNPEKARKLDNFIEKIFK